MVRADVAVEQPSDMDGYFNCCSCEMGYRGSGGTFTCVPLLSNSAWFSGGQALYPQLLPRMDVCQQHCGQWKDVSLASLPVST